MGERFLWDLPRSRAEMILSRPLVCKAPMQQTIIDSEGKIFNYEFKNGKVIYKYIATTIPRKREENDEN